MTSKKQGQWSSQLAFILATAGSAVGLGNIWKFPYIAGENGGGAFVLIYLLCVLFIGIPLMMAEITLGRAGKKNPATTMKTLALKEGKSSIWQWVGLLGIASSVIILSYYSVIAGWATEYVFFSMQGLFNGQSTEQISKLFDDLIASPYQLAFWHTVVIASTLAVVAMGVEKGIERAVKFLFPSMFALLLVIVGYAMNTGFFTHGLNFLFYPDFSQISANAVLSAMGHAFFTLSLAVGTVMMYGAYLPHQVSIVKSTFYIALADTLIALLAGLAIFPIVFSHGLMPGAGPGLIFKTLPLAFGQMPYGTFIGTVFFVMLVFAAFTSTISLLEPSVSWLMEVFGFSRVKSAFICGAFIWLLGFLTIFSFNIWADVKVLGHTFFDLFDIITANFMLPLTGLFIALFSAWFYKGLQKACDIKAAWLFKAWRFSLGVVTPIAILFVFCHVALGVI